MNTIPIYINLAFIAITFITVFVFYKATNNAAKFLIGIMLWLLLQALLGLNNFYTGVNQQPQRFALLMVPAIIAIILLLITKKGSQFVNSINIKILTLLHIIRVPVEFVLLGLSIYKVVPQLMTFEGRNFDILSGFTAPIVYYLYFVKKSLSKNAFIIWNVLCVGLLMNVVINAILSVPAPFQQFAFEQPNIAILFFPYLWLPSCVVPLVLLSHFVTIKQLLRKGSNS